MNFKPKTKKVLNFIYLEIADVTCTRPQIIIIHKKEEEEGQTLIGNYRKYYEY